MHRCSFVLPTNLCVRQRSHHKREQVRTSEGSSTMYGHISLIGDDSTTRGVALREQLVLCTF